MAKIGDIVLYKLTAEDAQAVTRKRQEFVAGNEAKEGDELPMIVVAVTADGKVNGHVFNDGCDTFWVQGVTVGTAEASHG